MRSFLASACGVGAGAGAVGVIISGTGVIGVLVKKSTATTGGGSASRTPQVLTFLEKSVGSRVRRLRSPPPARSAGQSSGAQKENDAKQSLPIRSASRRVTASPRFKGPQPPRAAAPPRRPQRPPGRARLKHLTPHFREGSACFRSGGFRASPRFLGGLGSLARAPLGAPERLSRSPHVAAFPCVVTRVEGPAP